MIDYLENKLDIKTKIQYENHILNCKHCTEELINLSDLDFFTRLLNKSERSCIFNCKKDMEKIRESGIKREIPNYFPYNF